MKDFKELKVWSKAHELTIIVYSMTRAFPRDEMYGLTSQMRRSAASIGANIAEGCGRRSDGELARFLQIARGSASETEYHLLLAKDLKFMSEKDYEIAGKKLNELQRMLTSLVQKVRPMHARGTTGVN
jgi:four helix bundle protein